MATKNIKKLPTKSKSKPKAKLKDTSNLIRINLRILKSLNGKIKKLALKEGVSMSEMISNLIKNYINNQSILESKNS
jgi:hypothetical protein